jgi:Trk K+ transport system NAD-binding subunit
MLVREGEAKQPRGSMELEAGDELLVLSDADDASKLLHLFEGRHAERQHA